MLNRSKPYGEIMGDPRAKYAQDGKIYDFQGNEVVDRKLELKKAPPTPEPGAFDEYDRLTKEELRGILNQRGVKYDTRWERDRFLALVREPQ